MTNIFTPARGLLFFLVGLSWLLGPLAARAQWVGSGPFDPQALRAVTQAVIVAPNGNWVAFGRGQGVGNSSFNAIYYSTNGGATWTATGQNLPSPPAPDNLRVYQFASQGGALFAATSTGLFTSLDNGVTWSARGTGLPATGGFFALRSLNGTLFAGIENGARTTTGDLVYRSLDNGASWQVASTGIPATTRGIADFATDGRGTLITCFYGTGGNVIFRSTDNGTTWNGVTNGVPNDFLPNAMGSVGNTLLVGGGFSSGILRSTDGGQSWQAANNGLTITSTGVFNSFATFNNTIYVTESNNTAYLFASSDGGQTWTRDASQPTEFTTIYVNGSTLFGAAFSLSSNIPIYTRQLASVVTAARPGADLAGLTAFPNPATELLTVRLPTAAGPATAALRDLTGRLVLAPAPLPGSGQLRLPASLPAGLYLLDVRQGDAQAVRRVLKQ